MHCTLLWWVDSFNSSNFSSESKFTNDFLCEPILLNLIKSSYPFSLIFIEGLSVVLYIFPMILSLVSIFLTENIFLTLFSSVGSLRILSKFLKSSYISFYFSNYAILFLSLINLIDFSLDFDLYDKRLCPDTERVFLKFLGFSWIRVFY